MAYFRLHSLVFELGSLVFVVSSSTNNVWYKNLLHEHTPIINGLLYTIYTAQQSALFAEYVSCRIAYRIGQCRMYSIYWGVHSGAILNILKLYCRECNIQHSLQNLAVYHIEYQFQCTVKDVMLALKLNTIFSCDTGPKVAQLTISVDKVKFDIHFYCVLGPC